jgi:hypothetical protein
VAFDYKGGVRNVHCISNIQIVHRHSIVITPFARITPGPLIVLHSVEEDCDLTFICHNSLSTILT